MHMQLGVSYGKLYGKCEMWNMNMNLKYEILNIGLKYIKSDRNVKINLQSQ